ncbi:hypothetical protein QUF56_12220 [Ureibacillus composti]|nr:hypothetical protein [Ureibacillus composti]
MKRRQPKMYYVLRCKTDIWKIRSVQLLKFLCFVGTLLAMFYFKLSLTIIVVILFGIYLVLKMLPAPYQETIEFYFDHFIFKSKVKEVTLYLNEIAFIDQDVEDMGKPYYKSIEFLNERMESLLCIDARGYEYDALVLLCNRIYEMNQFLASEQTTTKVMFAPSVDSTELPWEQEETPSIFKR